MKQVIAKRNKKGGFFLRNEKKQETDNHEKNE